MNIDTAHRIIERLAPHVQAVFIFPNGMVAVTDYDGRQIPFLQGPRDEVLPLIKYVIRNRMDEVDWNED